MLMAESLPAHMVQGRSGQVWPVLRSIPMGFSHGVVMAHSSLEHLIRRCGIARAFNATQLRGSGPFVLRDVNLLWFNYIDDHCVLSKSREMAAYHLTQSSVEIERMGLIIHPDKTVMPGTSQYTNVIGSVISVGGLILPPARVLMRAEGETERLLLSRRATPKRVEVLIGSWIWLLLLNRLTLSVVSNAVYEFIARKDRREVQLPQRVLNDFQLLLGMAPLLVVDLRMIASDCIIASDASLQGAGACRADITPRQWTLIMHKRVLRGWSSRYDGDSAPVLSEVDSEILTLVENLPWEVTVSKQFRHPETMIARCEAIAFYLAARDLVDRGCNNVRQPFLLDSQTVLGALVKGRSSSLCLNHLVRRAASLLMATGIRASFLWVPSAYNPADGPSRHFSS
jgi:hypothetical protein